MASHHPRRIAGRILLETRRFRVEELTEEGPDGRLWQRQLVRHPGAAVVVPVLDDGSVVLVEQHRTSADRVLLELPAGVLDGDEAPERAARRELLEETGYEAARWTALASCFAAPGLTDERFHIFLATGLTPGTARPEVDEWVSVRRCGADELETLLARGAIEDAKTLLGLLLARRRGAWGVPT